MKHKTLVIGGGIIGLSIAVTLAKQGEQVIIADAAQIGGKTSASYGNAGHLATEQVFAVADLSVLPQLPSMLLNPLGPLRIDWRYLPKLLPWAWKMVGNMRPSRQAHIHQALMQLSQHSLKSWQRFAEDWKLNQFIHLNGSILCCATQSQVLALQKKGKKLNAIGIRNEWLDKTALHVYEPQLADNQIGGLFFPETGHISRIPSIINQLKQAFQNLGGEIREYCQVKTAYRHDNDIVATLNDEIFGANRVVLCAGAYSKPLAKMLTGIDVPLDTERGYHLMLPQELARLNRPVTSAELKFIMTPMDNGLRLAGTVEYAGLQAPPNMARANNLLKLAKKILQPPINDNQAEAWMGFRPTIADSLPVIDRIDNVFLAFGHQHLGLTQAAITAEVISALYFEKKLPFAIENFSIQRFS